MSFAIFAYKLLKYLNPTFWIKYYLFEVLFIVSILLFIQIYIYGSKKNNRIAKVDFQLIAKELSKYFQNVGDIKTSGQLYNVDNPHTFKLYASQHTQMKFCLVALYLAKRENMFIYYGYDFVFPYKERLIIEIGILPQFRQFLCFGIVKATAIKRIKQEGYEDLKNICQNVTIPNLSNSLKVLSEYDDIAQMLLTDQIIELLNANSKVIHIIYISDVDKNPACKISVKLMFNYTDNLDYEKIIQLSTALSLQVATIKMDHRRINKSIQTRRKFNHKFKD